MISKSETSFGARLLKAQNIATYIANFYNYSPVRPEDSVVGMQQFLNLIIVLNQTAISSNQAYNIAVKNRVNAFQNNNNSLEKRLAAIRGVVLSQYGKDSIYFNQVNTLIKNIRNTQTIKKPATENTPEASISQSERSYGSLTQYFSNIVTILSGFEDYSPTNDDLKVSNLKQFVLELSQLNQKVASTYQAVRLARIERANAYADLSERVQRIKGYVKGTYGIKSEQFILIKGIRV